MIKFLKKHLNLIGHRVFLVPLIMIIQIAIIFLMTFEFYSYFIVFYIICSIFSLLMVLHIVNSRANPGYKIAWIISVMAFPIFGLLLYVLFGGNQLSKRQKDKMRNIYYKQFKYKDNHNIVMNELRYDNMSAYNQVKYISNYSLTNVCKHTKTTYLSSGKTYYNKLLEMLGEKPIHLKENEYFVTGDKTVKKYLKEISGFVAGRIATLILEMVIMWFFVTLLGMNSNLWVIIWTIVAQILVIVGNYVISKLFVFKK